MSLTEWVLKEGAKAGVMYIVKVGAETVGEPVWPLTLGIVGYGALNAALDADSEAVCKEASATYLKNCPHLKPVPMTWSPPTTRCHEAAFAYHGCAFLYKGTPLFHPESHLDTNRLAANVIRYDHTTKRAAYYKSWHLLPCQRCSRDELA
jgi:hypothetical protein